MLRLNVMRSGLYLALVGVAGCYEPSLRATCRVSCGAGASCPDGLTCGDDGLCNDGVRCTDAQVTDAMPDVPFDGPEEWGFSMIQAVPALSNTASDSDPTLTSDMTEIYFRSARTPGAGLDDIWYSTRATANDAWSAPMLSTLSTNEFDNQPRIAPDGLTIWFRRGAGATARLMVSTRTTAKDDTLWSAPTQLTEFDATDLVQDAALLSTSPTQTVGYLISKRGGTQVRIFRTIRTNKTQPWAIPMAVAELLGTGSYEQSPWVTPDQLTIVFDSNRPGCLGGGDIWVARRASPGAPFGAPSCLREVNTSGFEGAPWISPDLHHLYFRGPGGNGDIYEAHR